MTARRRAPSLVYNLTPLAFYLLFYKASHCSLSSNTLHSSQPRLSPRPTESTTAGRQEMDLARRPIRVGAARFAGTVSVAAAVAGSTKGKRAGPPPGPWGRASAVAEARGFPYGGTKRPWRWNMALFDVVLGEERTTHPLGLENRAAVVAAAANGDAAFAEILEVRPGNRRLAPAPAIASGRCTGSGQAARPRRRPPRREELWARRTTARRATSGRATASRRNRHMAAAWYGKDAVSCGLREVEC
jgi:hypothetical protein